MVNRIYDRKALLDEEAKEFLLMLLRNYEELLGLDLLGFCLMKNHYHLLIRVPHRPDGWDVPLEVVVERLDRALGADSAKLMHRQLAFWRERGNEAAVEEWRRRQIERMFSLSEFMKAVQLRFSRWYNLRNGRKGTLWEGRYRSVIVEEEERALRTIAAYIDLNPVRAKLVEDPADYRWSGYSFAMRGDRKSQKGYVRIIGQSAWPRALSVSAEPWGDGPFPQKVKNRALVHYRAILGGQGAAKVGPEGRILRSGIGSKTRQRLLSSDEQQLAAEMLRCRVKHFTRGVMIGSRVFINQWFEANRQVVRGRSQTDRTEGALPLRPPALRGLFSFRNPGTSPVPSASSATAEDGKMPSG